MADKYTNLTALTEFLTKIKAWVSNGFATKDTVTTSADGLMSSTDKTKLNGIATGATNVIESTVSGWGFTKNQGTITGITMNGASKGTSGNVDLGTVITSHQDISGKQDKITPITAQTTQALYPIKIDSQGHITSYGSAQTIPTKVSQLTNDSGYTTNTGTITGIMMNGASKGTSGNVDLGTVITSHQDISGKVDKINITAQNTQAVYPIKINAQGQIIAYGNAQTIPAAVRVKGNAESSYRTGDVNLTPADIGAATSSHTHGNIQNGGTLQTSDVAIASGDKLVITDSSDSNKVARASLAFDGSTTDKFLSKKGTFESASIEGVVYYDDTQSTSQTVPINADQLEGYSLDQLLALVQSMMSIDSDTVFSITKDDTGATLSTPITFKIVSKS